jgi:transaldolase
MQFFLDTANVNEIKELAEYGIIDGVTTNPTILAKTGIKDGENVFKLVKDICEIVPGDVSVEVASTEYEEMIKEGDKLSNIAENIVIKLPTTWHGIKACNYFSNKGQKTNLTLCFSVTQALVAAKAGATYISPFIGRIDDSGHNGLNLIEEIVTAYDNYPYLQTKILAASIRHTQHLREVALMGADVATMPAKVIKDLLKHPMTDIGLEAFVMDWKNSGLKI